MVLRDASASKKREILVHVKVTWQGEWEEGREECQGGWWHSQTIGGKAAGLEGGEAPVGLSDAFSDPWK